MITELAEEYEKLMFLIWPSSVIDCEDEFFERFMVLPVNSYVITSGGTDNINFVGVEKTDIPSEDLISDSISVATESAVLNIVVLSVAR